MSTPPAEVLALADDRAAAKQAKDFAHADALRSQIEQAGWRVLDGADGYTLVPKPAYEVVRSIAHVPALTGEISVGLIVEGWWEDVRACLDALLQHTTAVIYAVHVGGDEQLGTALERCAAEHADRIRAIHLESDPGWGQTARAIAELSTSPLHVLMDPSTVLHGDAFALLRAAFDDVSVVSAGWKGALVDVADQWRSVIDAGPGEVDVLLGYLMMVRREALIATEYPHPKARFYRNADIELSLGLRAAGGRLMAMDLPVEQGRHHGYHDSDPEFRDRESKRTYDRILAAFRGRTDLLCARNPAHA